MHFSAKQSAQGHRNHFFRKILQNNFLNFWIN